MSNQRVGARILLTDDYIIPNRKNHRGSPKSAPVLQFLRLVPQKKPNRKRIFPAPGRFALRFFRFAAFYSAKKTPARYAGCRPYTTEWGLCIKVRVTHGKTEKTQCRQVLFLRASGREAGWVALEVEALALAEKRRCAMAAIYGKILTAAAYRAQGMSGSAAAALKGAIELALPDRLYMPFAENRSLLGMCEVMARRALKEMEVYTRVRLGFRPQFAVGQMKRVLLTRVYGKFKCSSV
jgi:hypothetical protein